MKTREKKQEDLNALTEAVAEFKVGDGRQF